MDRAERAHSRLVRVLRIVLPTLAVAILATVFLVLRSDPPTPMAPGADGADPALPPTMTDPSFASVGRDGTEVRLRAAEATPSRQPSGESALRQAELRLVLPDGREIEAKAAEARLDPSAGEMALQGDVVIDDAQGWRMRSELLNGTTDGQWLNSPGPVSAEGPAGTLDAGSMEYDGSTRGSEVVVFKGGVRLLYFPDSPSESPQP